MTEENEEKQENNLDEKATLGSQNRGRCEERLSKSKSKKPKSEEEQPSKMEEEQEDAEFVLSATRAPRQGAFEQFLAQFLAQAVVVTDPLKRVKIVCEAALMVSEPQREDLAIDYEKIEVLNAVTNALLNPTVTRNQDANLVSIGWGFEHTEENLNKFIMPWLRLSSVIYDRLSLNKEHIKWHFQNWHPYKIVIDEFNTEPRWSFLFDVFNCLLPSGFAGMKNSLAAWAIPVIQLYLSELTHVVSPSLYSEILGLYEKRGKKAGYAEKVKEVEKETAKGGSDSEDNAG